MEAQNRGKREKLRYGKHSKKTEKELKTTMEKIREKVTKVLESGLSSYEIAKETGIQISSLSKYRNSKYCLDNMTLSIAEKLAGFYDKNHKREGFVKK